MRCSSLDLNKLRYKQLFYGIWSVLESSDGHHFSCYGKGVGKMSQLQRIAFAEQMKLIFSSPHFSYDSVFEFLMFIVL